MARDNWIGRAKAFLMARPSRMTATLLAFCLITTFVCLDPMVYPTHQPAYWHAGGVLAFGLIVLKGRWRLIFAGLSTVGIAVLATMLGWSDVSGPLFALLSLGEAALCAWLTLRLSQTPRVANMIQATKLIFLAILPSALAYAVVAGGIRLAFGQPFALMTWQAFAGHFFGMLTMLPTLLLLATPERFKPPQKGWIERTLIAGALLTFLIAPFGPLANVTFLLVLPAATVFAFRIGPKPTVVSMLAINTVSNIYWWLSPTPAAWSAQMTPDMTIFIGQGYEGLVYLTGLYTGLAIAYQARIKALLETKTRAARRARARAVKASQAKTDFLATMSHEIRTPLNGVIGFTQVLLKREGLESEVREQIELIGSSGYALLTVVNDILDFSKVEAGQVALNPRPCRLADTAREAIAIVEPEANRKGLDIELKIKGDAGQARMVDDQRLRQVLINLLNNAVKFTKTGGVRLKLIVKEDGVRFEVRDTGAGIAPDALPRLFQRFTQADSSITRSHGGTGLGLAISKGLVEMMGGRIGAESRLGEGSTFWFEFDPPVAEIDDAQDAEGDGDAAAISAHVLLVDDHPVNRQLGVTVLAMLGCTADTAENGEVAVQAMRTARYDLVLMDVHMPIMDGLEATRAIRALGGEAAKTPIITMSADVLPEQVARFQAAGMDDRVSKPLDIQDLYGCLVRWTGPRSDPDDASVAA